MGITVVQHRSSTAVSTGLALAYASNNAANNLLVYFTGSNSGSITTATDNNSNTIANVNTRSDAGGGEIRVDDVVQCNAGANTVTVHDATANRLHNHIWEISGCTATPLDQQNTGGQTGTNQSISTSSATTVANEIVFGFFYDHATDDSLTAGSGFSPSEFSDGGAGNESALSEVKIVSATGTQTATCTCGSNTNPINQSIATFKGSASNVVFEDDSFPVSNTVNSVMDIPIVISIWG